MTAVIKKYKTIIKKKKKKLEKIVFSANVKLNAREDLNYKALIDWNNSLNEGTEVIKKYFDMKQAIKNPESI